jgi:hypothetical protein
MSRPFSECVVDIEPSRERFSLFYGWQLLAVKEE